MSGTAQMAHNKVMRQYKRSLFSFYRLGCSMDTVSATLTRLLPRTSYRKIWFDVVCPTDSENVATPKICKFEQFINTFYMNGKLLATEEAGKSFQGYLLKKINFCFSTGRLPEHNSALFWDHNITMLYYRICVYWYLSCTIVTWLTGRAETFFSKRQKYAYCCVLVYVFLQ